MKPHSPKMIARYGHVCDTDEVAGIGGIESLFIIPGKLGKKRLGRNEYK